MGHRNQVAVLGSDRRHVAGGAGRGRRVVLAENPLRVVELEVVFVGAECDPVLGLLVDLRLWVIGAEVALAAVLGSAGLLGRELVALMARGAGADAAVGVEPAHAGIGPARGRQRAVVADLDHRAVTLLAARHRQRRAAVVRPVALDDVGEEVVE